MRKRKQEKPSEPSNRRKERGKSMKKIIKLLKSDSTFLLIIIHVITSIALIIFISLKYDWIVEKFGSYTLFVATCAPIGGFIVGGYYFVADYFSLYFNKDKESEDDVNV